MSVLNTMANGPCPTQTTTVANDTEALKMLNLLSNDSVDKSSLQGLYAVDPVLFEPQFIQTIIRLSSLPNYTALSFAAFGEIINASTTFQHYVKGSADAQGCQTLLEIYLKAINNFCRTGSYIDMKNKIFSMMKIVITINTYTTSSVCTNATVTVNSGFNVNEGQIQTSSIDIQNMLKSNIEQLQPKKVILFEFDSEPCSVKLTGPIFQDVISNVLGMQDIMLKNAMAMKVQVRPYLKVKENLPVPM